MHAANQNENPDEKASENTRTSYFDTCPKPHQAGSAGSDTRMYCYQWNLSFSGKYKEDIDHEANYEFHTFKEDGAPSGQRGASGH